MENRETSGLQESDVLALAGNHLGLMTMGIETRLKANLLILIHEYVNSLQIHVKSPCSVIASELGAHGEQYRRHKTSTPILGRDVWNLLIIVAKTCDVLQDERKFERLADLTAQLIRGVAISGRDGKTRIAGDEPDLPTWFNLDLRPSPHGILDSERNIHRVIYFIGCLCANRDALLPDIRDELFMPCAALITMDVPHLKANTSRPPIIAGANSTDTHQVWATQIVVAAQWMRFCGPRFVEEAWKDRFKVKRGERLPWPVHATYPDPDGQKWQIWMAWKAGFRKAANVLTELCDKDQKAAKLKCETEEVLKIMGQLEDGLGEEAERQRDIQEAEDEGSERVEY